MSFSKEGGNQRGTQRTQEMEDSIQKEEQRKSTDNKNTKTTECTQSTLRLGKMTPETISKMKLTEQTVVFTFLRKEILDYWEKVWA